MLKTLGALVIVLLLLATTASARDVYTLEVSKNDEWFVINGELFQARTYCFNMEEGDPIVFLDGSPHGVCVSATLFNLRTKKTCEVWCE